MEKALEIKSKWVEKFDCGLIQITGQKYRKKEFFQNSASFTASNGMELMSSVNPEYLSSTTFYVRGHNNTKDDVICVIPEYETFHRILNAIDEYNDKRVKKIPDYVKLHKLLWGRLSLSGSHDKNSVCQQVMYEEGIPKENTPSNYCFLCQDTEERAGAVKCEICKGFWGAKGLNCKEFGSYYQMWASEKDLTLRKALAARISNNTAVKSSSVLPMEVEVALQQGKVAAIKMYRNRTGSELREAKEAIEEAIVNQQI